LPITSTAQELKAPSSARKKPAAGEASRVWLSRQALRPYMAPMHPDPDLKRLHWRAHHRGTKEADLLVGGFFDAHCEQWSSHDRALFSEMLDEQDVDIMAWAHGTAEPPERFDGPMIDALKKLDYVRIAR
jgi:antitoxin CptB